MNEVIVRPSSELRNIGSPVDEPMPTSAEKAAIILSILDPKDASELLQTFKHDSLMEFARVINSLRPVPSSVTSAVVTEFLIAMGAETNIDEILSDISGKDVRSVWERLGDAPNAAIWKRETIRTYWRPDE